MATVLRAPSVPCWVPCIRGRSLPLLLVIMLSAQTGAGLSSAVSRQPGEAELKAEFIERFTRFIEWPEGEPGSQSAPFIIGVIGSTPVTRHLERVARDRRFQGREARVLQIRKLGSVGRCDLVFIASTEDKRLGDILERTSGRPILTISDSPGFCERGVLINLYLEDGYLHFEINRAEVERAGLRAEAQLLRLARIISVPKLGSGHVGSAEARAPGSRAAS